MTPDIQIDDDDDEEEDDEEEEEKPKKKLPKKEKNPAKKKPSKKKSTKKSAVTREDVFGFLAGFVDNHGRKPVQALLKKLGASKLTELDEAKYGEFLERLEAYDKRNREE